MREMTAKDAENNFGRLLDVIQSGAAWEKLTGTMDALGQEATEKGLTEAELESLLADES